ncbi:Uncharacterised protein [Raoultella terrigena]|uniref:Uncharacterized protein n=1 Tax=Raoultella terrigena TaxID=577 RepID=A0A4V6J191_RAOTE|nr:Uncharacterised protein [Raoultella terrigena]
MAVPVGYDYAIKTHFVLKYLREHIIAAVQFAVILAPGLNSPSGIFIVFSSY